MEEQRFQLRSGDGVFIRPLRSSDAPALATAFEQLTEQSRYRRFHSAMPHLSEQMLKYLTDIDHHDHEALVALAPGSTEIVGVARFIRDLDTPDTAELAIVVADAWQRRGLGTVLMRELAGRAADVGISHFTAEILSENMPTLALVDQFDANLAHNGPTTTARIRIDGQPATPPTDIRSLLRALAGANVVLVPRLLQVMLDMSADLTRTLILPIRSLLRQPREPAG